MLSPRQLPVAFVLFIALISCRQSDAGPADPAAVRQAIDSSNATFAEDVKAGRSAQVASHYSEDATLMPPNMATAKGRAGIDQTFGQMMQGFTMSDFKLTTTDVRVSGDMARELGTYRLSGTAGGQTVADSGKYIVIWVRQPDGKWLMESDVWNSDVPLPPPPSAPAAGGTTKSG